MSFRMSYPFSERCCHRAYNGAAFQRPLPALADLMLAPHVLVKGNSLAAISYPFAYDPLG